ncbi:Ig-like domain-containing protein [Citricoccus zhacaiensis]|uniref:Ig-like domain-containing protein n=1 Tax=Citricoccus zhacaiensis TaxID=489142 RepID=UPI00166B06FE|nr:Ig-like domain-containing protein [Citricoccus zhacaiensis]
MSRAFPLLGRSVATIAGTLVVLAGLVGTAQATPMPSPSDSLGPTQSAAPAPTPPSSSPSPPSGANQPPQIDCPGLMTQAGDTESVRIPALDPDGDTITLSAGTSWLGGEATVEGHVVTYTAPTDVHGTDGLIVTADDGRGGTSNCEISILVQAGPSHTPTPTPTPTPSTTPTPTPTSPSPTPAPTSSTPEPGPEPTSGSGTPTQAPTSGPTAGPTRNPATPSGSSPTTGAATGTPSNGGGGNGSPSGSAPGDAGDNGSSGGGSGGQTPDGPGSPSAPAAEMPSAQKLSNIIRDTAIACPVRAVADAEKLIAGISAGMTSRPGGGNFPSGDGTGNVADGAEGASRAATDGPGSTEPVAAAERTTHTGSTLWLFAGVGFMMIALIALALAALPRGERRH